MNYNQMTIPKFLKIYLGIENEHFNKLTHKDMKELFPHLERKPFDCKNYNNDVLIIQVIDSKGRVIPYAEPKRIDIESIVHVDVEYKKNCKEEKKEEEYSPENLKCLPFWELGTALSNAETDEEIRRTRNAILYKTEKRAKVKKYSPKDRRENKGWEEGNIYGEYKRR